MSSPTRNGTSHSTSQRNASRRNSASGTGLGCRRSFSWRFEALYIWTRSRDTTDEGFSTDDNSIDIRVKRLL